MTLFTRGSTLQKPRTLFEETWRNLENPDRIPKNLQNPLESPGIPWSPLESPRIPWNPLETPRIPRKPQESPLSFHLRILNNDGLSVRNMNVVIWNPQNPLESPESLGIPQNPLESPRIPLNPLESPRIPWKP